MKTRPAQHGLHTGDQLPDLEWLGDVIIGSDPQAQDNIDLLPLGGNHDNGDPPCRFALFQIAADLYPIHTGKHDVQEHKVRLQGPCLFESLEAIHAAGHLVAFLLEIVLNHLEDIFFVLDHQYPWLRHSKNPSAQKTTKRRDPWFA